MSGPGSPGVNDPASPTLARPVSTTEAIREVARELLRGADDPRRRVRLVGVSVSGFERAPARQLALFDSGEEETGDGEAESRLADVVQTLAERFGSDALTRAALLEDRPRR